MSFIESMVEARNTQRFSQAALGKKCGVTQAAISKYERGITPMPDDIATTVAEELGARLKAIFTFEKKSNLYNVPLLNNVDDHIITVLEVLAEEFEEAAKAAKRNIKLLRNKKQDNDIDADTWHEIIENEIQIVDPIPAINLHLVTMEEKYERYSIKELEKMQYNKLKEKKYHR